MFEKKSMEVKLSKLKNEMTQRNIKAIIISKPVNIRYLSGFSGSAGFILIDDHDHRFLITDFRYISQAKLEAPNFEILEYKNDINKKIKTLLNDLGITKTGFESHHLRYEQYLKLKEDLSGIELVPISNLIEGIRKIKTAEEISLIKEAVKIAENAFTHIVKIIKPGIRELDISAELEYFMKKYGSERPAFDTIVASGPRSAFPHGKATERKLENGDFVTIDFGSTVNGYRSDITRTVILGNPSQKQREVYETVLRAQRAALEQIKHGVKASDADLYAREVINTSGYGRFFGHGLGHGVGLDIHEEPGLSPKSKATLEDGMVVTVEPGIYISDWGGVRIEDLVVVRHDGVDNLVKLSKDLISI
ncbi:MAG: Xaa-Pro aminopeptidase [Thermosediminibacterales bacterium]|nr:Xaa-Pro aminopeptidase [Thermosediminibacterales bacterium]